MSPGCMRWGGRWGGAQAFKPAAGKTGFSRSGKECMPGIDGYWYASPAHILMYAGWGANDLQFSDEKTEAQRCEPASKW